MTPSRSQRKSVALEMSNKSHIWFALKPTSLEVYLGFFTSVGVLVMKPLVIHKAKYSQYALPVKEAAGERRDGRKMIAVILRTA